METILVKQKPSEVLLEKGWVQGCFVGKTGACCALGLIRVAFGSEDPSCSTMPDDWKKGYQKFIQSLNTKICGDPELPGACIITWNDHRNTTKDMVVAMLQEVEQSFDIQTGV